MTAWGMTVDLNRCVGCQTCTIACKEANATPPGVQWRRVIDVEYGTFPNVERLFVVTGCQHCENPPCVPVCPSGATARRADGLVTIDYDICIGCASCVVACPYQARSIVNEKKWYYRDGPTAQEMLRPHEERVGVANKCSFCMERIDAAADSGQVPGRDLDATPACVTSCISQALKFGDLDDAESDVSRLIRDNQSFQMHAELGTNPRVRYLYEVPASTPGRDIGADDADDAALSDSHNALVGERQTFWDYRAAMNFSLGGMASGLALIAWLAYLARWIDAAVLPKILVPAAAIMAVGLFFVFLKLGRKMRFLYVLRRPQSSWMTRETYCIALFYPAVAGSVLWPGPGIYALTGISAAGFLYSQAQILFSSKGIPAWRVPLIPWMLMTTGLFEGVGLFAVILSAIGTHSAIAGEVGIAGLTLAILIGGLWVLYHQTGSASGIGPLSMKDISGMMPMLMIAAFGTPALLFAVSIAMPKAAAVAGMVTVAGGFFWKYALVTRICHQQGFALPKVPQRGSGVKAAPTRTGVSPAAVVE